MSKFCAKNVGQPGTDANRQNVQILVFSIFLVDAMQSATLPDAMESKQSEAEAEFGNN